MRFDISYLGDNNVMWGKNLRVGPALKLLGTDGVCVRARVRVCVCVCVCNLIVFRFSQLCS